VRVRVNVRANTKKQKISTYLGTSISTSLLRDFLSLRTFRSQRSEVFRLEVSFAYGLLSVVCKTSDVWKVRTLIFFSAYRQCLKTILQATFPSPKNTFEGPEKRTFSFDPPNFSAGSPPQNPKNRVDTCKIAAQKFERRIQY
jgi:hypothetical protein